MDTIIVGIGALIVTVVACYVLLEWLPAVYKYLGNTIFKIRKKVFESLNPKYVLQRHDLLKTRFVSRTKRTYYVSLGVGSPGKFAAIYKNKIEFYKGVDVSRSTSILVNVQELYNSLKAKKTWDPEGNGLKVESVDNQDPTYKLSLEDRKYPETNRFLIEVYQEDFMKALKKTIDL